MYWHVRANFSGSTSAWSVTQNFFTANPPSVPSLASPANNALVTTYTPLLDWNNVTVPTGAPAFDHYEVQVATTSTFTSIAVDQNVTGLTNSSYTLTTPLAPNTTYYWRVLSVNSVGGYGQWSSVWSFRTVIVPPTLTAPANAVHLSYNRPTFNWNIVTGANGYTIQIAKDSLFKTMVTNTSVTAATYTPTADLPANLTLYWRVQAKGANGPSSWSSPLSLITANPPSIPTLVSPASNALTTNYTPLLAWKVVTVPVGAPAFDHYQVQVATNSTFTALVVDESVLGLTNLSYTLPAPLAPNTTYYWRVCSYNTIGQYSAWSAVWTLRTALLLPTLSSPTTNSFLLNNRPSFDWNDVTGATGYTIQIAKDNLFKTMVTSTSVTPSTYTPSSALPANIPLYWRVQTKGTNGPSAWSDVWQMQVANPPVLVSPANNATVTTTAPSFSWNSLTGAAKYEIQISTANTFITFSDHASPAVTNYTSAYLANGTYYWRVRGVDIASTPGPWSATWAVKVNSLKDTTPPTNPSSLTSSSHTVSQPSNNNQVVVSWSGDASDNVGGSGVAGYSTLWDQNPGSTPSTTVNHPKDVLTETSTSLADGSWYFHLRTCDYAGNCSTPIHLGPFMIDTTPPAAISDLNATTGTADGSVDLTWTAPGDNGTTGTAASYLVRYSASAITDQTSWDSATVVATGIPTPQTADASEHMTFSGLTDGATYYFAVRAKDSALNLGGFSNSPSAEAKPDTTPPTNPSSLTSSSHTVGQLSNNNQVVVNWSSDASDSGGSGVAGYSTLWDQNADSTPGTTVNHLTDVLTETSNSLADGSWYFHLCTCDQVGNCSSPIHLGPFMIDTTPPASISDLNATNGTVDGSVDLTWTASGDNGTNGTATSYLVRYSATAITDQTGWDSATVVTTGIPTPQVAGSSEHMTVTGLAEGTTYYFVVRAEDSVSNLGELSNSPSAEAKLDTTPPAAVTDLSAQTGTTVGTVDLSWTASGDDGTTGTATSYLVRYSSTEITDQSGWDSATIVTAGIPTPQVAGSSESLIVSGLTPGDTYYFAVIALDEVGNEGGLSNSPSAEAMTE
jgi:hypothetical protein